MVRKLAELIRGMNLVPAHPANTPAAAFTRRSFCFGKMVRLFALLIVMLGCPASLRASRPLSEVAPDLSTRALEHADSTTRWLLNTLRDSEIETSRRLAAARLLLESNLPGAQAQLRLDLATWPDPQVRQIILQALALSNPPPLSFADLLLEMLRSDPQPPPELSQALGRYADPVVLAQLSDLALDSNANLSARVGAVRALAWHRSQTVVGLLIQLIEPGQPPVLRQTAFEALSGLTGISDLGQDTAAWQRWWQQNRNLPVEIWQQRIMENLERSRYAAETYTQRLQQRLSETSRQLYRSLAPEQQVELLISFLNDPLEALRQLGLELTAERLAGAPTAGLPEGVVRALIARFEDPVPALRRRAALLLRDAGSGAAADRAAEILQSGQETRPELIQAYLLLLTRLPRAAAVQRAVEFLENPFLVSEAADFLRAADEGGLLLASQRQEVLVRLRRVLEDPGKLTPACVGLLGRVGQEEDWRRIREWLKHEDAAIRKASAQTWARSDRPLDVLLEAGWEAQIRPIILDAAVRRGWEPGLLLGLIEIQPEGESEGDLWRRAVVAVAGRAPGWAVLKAQEALARKGQQVQVRLQLITAALERWLPAGASGQRELRLEKEEGAVVAELLLARAGIYMERGEAAAALSDCKHIDELGLGVNSDQRERQVLLMVEAGIKLGEDEVILQGVENWLRVPSGERSDSRLERLAQMLAERAEQHIQAKEEPKARELINLAAKLPLEGLSGTLVEHIRQLEAQLKPPAASEAEQGTSAGERSLEASGGGAGDSSQADQGSAGKTERNGKMEAGKQAEAGAGGREPAKP